MTSFMNQDQVNMLIRVLFAGGSPLVAWLIAHNVTNDQINAFQTILISLIGVSGPIASAVWGWFTHTISGKVAAVENLHGVKVVVSPTASAELRSIAADNSRPNVVSASMPMVNKPADRHAV